MGRFPSSYRGWSRFAVVPIAVSIAAALAPPASASPGHGELDPTFGIGGTVTTTFDASARRDAYVKGGLLQPDGKIVVAGETGGKFLVARYEPDGSPDPTFGTGGIAATYVGRPVAANAAVLEADGSIVAAGTLEGPSGALAALVRYGPDGSLDTSFGSGGVVITDLGLDAGASAAAVQPDGKIVVAGEGEVGGEGELVTARYDADGSLDESFAGTGIARTNVGGAPLRDASAAIQPDGKILAAGINLFGFTMVRYNPDGSLDATFGAAGRVTTNVEGSPDGVAMLLQPDGKVVLGGATADGLRFARYDTDGSLDVSFGSGGVAAAPECCPGRIELTLQSDGELVAAMDLYGSTGAEFELIRLSSGGTVDSDFGSNGVASVRLDHENGAVAGIASDPSGRLLVLGDSGDCVAPTGTGCDGFSSNVTLARFGLDGAVDSSFGSAGVLTTRLGNETVPGGAVGEAILVQPDRRILVIGADGHRLTLSRYTSDGRLDPSFGDGGRVVVDDFGRRSTDAALQRNGKIVVVGAGGLLRFDINGVLDRSFGDQGVVPVSGAREVALQPDHRILACCVHGGHGASLVRYRRDGSRDVSFGRRGRAPLRFRLGESGARGLIVERGGRIVVAAEGALLGFRRNGKADRSFGHHGFVPKPAAARAVSIEGVLRASHRRLLVFGQRRRRGTPALFRYRANGAPDRAFGKRGRVLSQVRASVGPQSVGIEPNGKIVVACTIGSRLALVRFNGNGSLDRSFGDGGRAVSAVNGFAFAVAPTPRRRILVAGKTNVAISGRLVSPLLLARFRG